MPPSSSVCARGHRRSAVPLSRSTIGRGDREQHVPQGRCTTAKLAQRSATRDQAGPQAVRPMIALGRRGPADQRTTDWGFIWKIVDARPARGACVAA